MDESFVRAEVARLAPWHDRVALPYGLTTVSGDERRQSIADGSTTFCYSPRRASI